METPLAELVDQVAKPILRDWQWRAIEVEHYYDERNADGEWQYYTTVDYSFVQDLGTHQNVIYFQEGKYGGSYFYVEVGVFVPVGVHKPDEDGVTIGSCVLRKRHEDIKGKPGTRYSFSDTPPEEIHKGMEIDLREHILPYLGQTSTRAQVVERCLASGHEFEKVAAALLLAEQGDARGAELFAEVMQESNATAWKEVYRSAAQRVGIG